MGGKKRQSGPSDIKWFRSWVRACVLSNRSGKSTDSRTTTLNVCAWVNKYSLRLEDTWSNTSSGHFLHRT